MTSSSAAGGKKETARLVLPPGYGARRGLNWSVVGLLYTSCYMCRYNISIANKAMADEFHFSKENMGDILAAFFYAYAIGHVVNGLLTDLLGWQKALLIGAAGTVICNLAFGAASFMGMLWLFIVLRGIDGYAQSFGAPGFIKINASWFSATERGTFAGVFGFMINFGRVAINQLGPAGIAAIVAVALAIWVKDTPEEAGFHEVFKGESDHDDVVKADLRDVFVTIVANEFVWIIAGAYQWFPRYMQAVHKINLDEPLFLVVGFLIPVVASAGSFISGVVSDHLFGGRRAPVAAWICCIEIVTILIASRVSGATTIAVAFVMVAFTANSTHSLLGPAAAMDIGGRKAAAFASGCIHSFQYLGAGFAIQILGRLLAKTGYTCFFYFKVPWAVVGAVLMFSMAGQRKLRKGSGH